MRIAVVGAGATGAYRGAAVHRGGTGAHLIARGAHLTAMRANGVRVLSPRGDFTAHPHVTGDPREIGPAGYVFPGLKAYSYPACGPLAGPLLHERTAVVAGQNGIPRRYFHRLAGPYEGRRIEAVDPGGATSAVLPPERAIGCVAYPAAVTGSPGVIRHPEGTRFSAGEPSGEITARCTAPGGAVTAGGLKSPVEANPRDDIWVKLTGNASFNPVSALPGATMAEICGHGPARQVVAQVMEEILDIAARAGSRPEMTAERRLRGAGRAGHHKTPVLQDLEAGKRLELDALVTAAVEIAGMTGAPAPTLRTVQAAAGLPARVTRARASRARAR